MKGNRGQEPEVREQNMNGRDTIMKARSLRDTTKKLNHRDTACSAKRYAGSRSRETRSRRYEGRMMDGRMILPGWFRSCHSVSPWYQATQCFLAFVSFVCFVVPLCAQCTFSSGSTGADGAFTPTNSMPGTGWSVSNNVVTVTNSANGVFNFTSVYIETNWTVKFTKNTVNTPVFILATTNVTIKGTIDVAGAGGAGSPLLDGGLGGPGGFGGGTRGAVTGNGLGPGAGLRHSDYGGNAGFAVPATGFGAGGAYGTLDVVPFIGGSGGGAKSDRSGAGGGGALLIASSTTIDVQGTIDASGGSNSNPLCGGGAGSGGAIRLIANTLQGEGAIKAPGGGGPCGSASVSYGRIRLEACSNHRVSVSDPPFTFGPPGVVFLSTNPTINVTAIAGESVTWPPAGSLTDPDVYLPTTFTNPATISVTASNVPVDTVFKVIVTPAYGTNIVATNSLSGAYAASTGSVSMNVYTDRVWRVNALIDYIERP